MTEMERMLKESLLALEGELAAKLHRQETGISGQQTRMEDQGRQIQALRAGRSSSYGRDSRH